MGQLVSKIYGAAKREIITYNVENRAEKVISRDKPLPAPKYPSTVDELRRLEEENVSKEYLLEKNEQLDGYLKKVYVTSPAPTPQVKRIINPNRPLPLSRLSVDDLPYGYSEAEEKQIAHGRVSLKQALQFIGDHQSDNQKHSALAISTQYRLPVATVEDILDHFKMFNAKVQKKSTDPDLLSSSEKLRNMVKNVNPMTMKEVLEAGRLEAKKFKENLKISQNNIDSRDTSIDNDKELNADKTKNKENLKTSQNNIDSRDTSIDNDKELNAHQTKTKNSR